MRALTIRQPWAWAVIHAGKTVENRSRNIAGDYRGLVAIHASTRDDLNAFTASDVCWCPTEDKNGNCVPCHADVLLELANE